MRCSRSVLLLLLLVLIRRWISLVQTAGEDQLDDCEVEFCRKLTVSCRAAFSHFGCQITEAAL